MTALIRKRAGSGAGLAIVLGGLIAGVVDITVADVMSVMNGGSPLRMLQGIATGLLGMASFRGGLATAALGLACHFSITLGAAAAYYAVSRWLRVMVREPVVCGLLYGVPIYLIVNFVIVPLSRIGRVLPGSPGQVMFGVVVLMVGVGLPIGLMTRRFAG